MKNFEEFYNKNCVITVSFASSGVGGGSQPVYFYGKFLGENENCVVFDAVGSCGVYVDIKALKNKRLSGKISINKSYVILVNEAE